MSYVLFVHSTTQVSSTLYDMATRKGAPRSEPSPAGADSLRDFVVEKAVEKAAEKLEHSLNAKAAKVARQQEKAARQKERSARQKSDRQSGRQSGRQKGRPADRRTDRQQDRSARQQERLSAKAARAAEHLDRLSEHLEMLELWTRTEPAGRQPRFTRDQIAAAAIRIADAEGADALSMRRIAAELDAGTMTLYHYIRTKDELLQLVGDAIMGEIVLGPDQPLPADWRAAVTVIAERTRTVLLRHPWILDVADDPTLGPNGVRHFDQTIQAVASLDADLATKLDVVSAVDEYVFGYCLNQRNNAQDAPQLDRTMVDYFETLIATGDYPALRALADGLGVDESWAAVQAHMHDDTRFARTLGRLLDGIELGLADG
jgi:AcrR family transcriptional regulator